MAIGQTKSAQLLLLFAFSICFFATFYHFKPLISPHFIYRRRSCHTNFIQIICETVKYESLVASDHSCALSNRTPTLKRIINIVLDISAVPSGAFSSKPCTFALKKVKPKPADPKTFFCREKSIITYDR